MKRAIKACWRTSRALGAAGLLFAAMAAWGEDGQAAHLIRAEVLAVDCDTSGAPPSEVDSRHLQGEWTTVELPDAPLPRSLSKVNASLNNGCMARTLWYRLRLPDLPLQHGPLVLYAARIKVDGPVAVYGDGHRLHQAQIQGALWNSSRVPLWVVLDDALEADHTPPRELLIRMAHSPRSPVALTSLWIGEATALRWRYELRLWFQTELPAMCGAAFLAVGLFSLFVWNRRRHETRYLMFFILSVTSYLRGLHFYVGVPIGQDMFGWLTVNSLFWLIVTVHFFQLELHGRKQPRVTNVLVGIAAAMAVLTLPELSMLPNTTGVRPLIYLFAMLMGISVSVAGAIGSWHRSRTGMLLAVGVGICTLLGADDWLLQNNFIHQEGWYLGAYTNLVTFSIFSYIMYRRYVDAIDEVERSNASLEQRLMQREADLDESYQRLRLVEQRETLSQERQRLMQDMHDGLGSSLRTALWAVEKGQADETVIAEVLKACIDDLKLTIDSMEPVDADLLLLLAALRYRLGSRLENSGIALRWEVQDVPALDWLDPRNALHILRILQEAFTNIIKHTRATEIRVTTDVDGDGVVIAITDNGQGFDLASAMHSGGKGLSNQERRTRAIGGRIRWESSAAGTRLVLWLPQKRAVV